MADKLITGNYKDTETYKKADGKTRSKLEQFRKENKIENDQMYLLLLREDYRGLPKEEVQKGNRPAELMVLSGIITFLVLTANQKLETLPFIGVYMIIATIIAIPIGLFNAKRAGTIADNITTALALVFMSMPSFWLGLMLLIFFSNKLKIFPAAYDGTWKCYVLPVVASGVSMSASTIRQTRSAVLEVSRQDFLRTARAKGVSERNVIRKHALKNAWIPIITTIGTSLSRTMAGSAVVETVYSFPGVGQLTVDAVNRRDVTMATGCIILSIIYIILRRQHSCFR